MYASTTIQVKYNAKEHVYSDLHHLNGGCPLIGEAFKTQEASQLSIHYYYC